MRTPTLRSLLIAATLTMSAMTAFADDAPNVPAKEEAEIETAAPAPAVDPHMVVRVDASVNQPTPSPTDDPPSCTKRPSRRFRVALAKVLAEVARVVARAQ